MQIQNASVSLVRSYYDCLCSVASERLFLEMIEPLPFEKVLGFQRALIEMNGPDYYAVTEGRVVGWCDVFPEEGPRQNHRGGLGMGVHRDFRGKKIGAQLLEATLAKAKVFGLEKVELHVYTTNTNAIALYNKFGFIKEGLLKNYRKLDGQYFDCLAMAKFL